MSPHRTLPQSFPAFPRQKGATLLVLFLVLGVAAAALLVTTLTRKGAQIKAEETTVAALATAKDALIGFAAGVGLATGRPGDLPCPDTHPLGDANEGISSTPCDGNAIGRLPWRTLGLPDLRDASGERLWYAVSVNFKNSTRTGTLNSDTLGTLTVRDPSGTITHDGSGTTGAVAVIIAPGGVLTLSNGTTQTRAAAGYLTPANYLDIANGEDNTDFVNGSTNGFINGPVNAADGSMIANDRLLAITPGKLMPVLEKRVSREALNCLTGYAASAQNMGRYPWAVPLTLYPAYTGQSGTRFGRFPDAPAGGGSNPTANSQMEQSINNLDAARDAFIANPTAETATALQDASVALRDSAQSIRDEATSVRDAASDTRDAARIARDRAENYIRNPSASNRTRAINAANDALTQAQALLALMQGGSLNLSTTTLQNSINGLQSALDAFEASPNATTARTLQTAADNLSTVANSIYNSASRIRSAAGTTVSAANSAARAAERAADNLSRRNIRSAINTSRTAIRRANTLLGRLPAGGGSGTMTTVWPTACNINLGTWWANWKMMMFYAIADAYKPVAPLTSPACGTTGTCLTVNPPSASADKRVVVFAAGRQLSGQTRTGGETNIANYLELQNATPGDDLFSQGTLSATFNDTVLFQ